MNFIGTYVISCEDVNIEVIIEEIDSIYNIELDSQIINYTMLYDEGDECKDITGGWIRRSYDCGTFIKNSNHLYFTGVGNGKNYNNVSTSNMIDLSEYYKVYSKVYIDNDYYTSNNYFTWWRHCLCNGILAGYTNTNITYADDLINSEGNLNCHINSWKNLYKLISVNVTTSPAYLYFHYGNWGINGTYGVKLYNSFAVKEDNYQKLLNINNLSIDNYPTIEDLIDSDIFDSLFNNKSFVKYLIRNCTGSIMMSIIDSEKGLNAIRNSIYIDIIYLNIHWNKFLKMIGETPEFERIYLYNKGDENIELTGGFVQQKIHNNSVCSMTKEDDYIHIYGQHKQGSNFGDSCVFTTNKINVASYKKLSVELKNLKMNGSPFSGNMYLFVATNRPGIESTSFVASQQYVLSSNKDFINLELDITNVTSSVYIGVYLYPASTVLQEVNIDLVKLYMS